MDKEKVITLLNQDLQDEHGPKEAEDDDLKKLLIRIRDNEIYHTAVFSDLLTNEEK